MAIFMAKAGIITDKSGLAMRIALFWLALWWAAAASAVADTPSNLMLPELAPAPLQSRSVRMTADMLSHYHYKSVPLDDALSEKIFDQYLKAIDPERLFFDQGDIDRLSKARTVFDDAIAKGDLRVPFVVFNTYLKRVVERYDYARSLLKTHFDFSEKEYFEIDRSKEPWAKNEQAISDLWRKRVKNDWLRLHLAGKDDKSIFELLDRRYETYVKRISQMKSDDAFQTFMNAYTMAIEPHTNYLAPRAAEEFGIAMKLSLVGIGAVLAAKDDVTVIREVVPGGPADLSGQIKSGDRILGVAQGAGGEMKDVQGMRLDDVVAMIRGAADSIVVLDVLPAEATLDGKHQTISLIRKKITLAEQSARQLVITITEGAQSHRIGVISLPSFYEDVEARQAGDPNFKSASRDVALLLDELKAEKVESIVVDLRNDGGGSLSEAVNLTGLFVGKGPVVQTRDAQGSVSVNPDAQVAIAWDGPLGVLINRGSASASEIFAAAIQDYGRGLIFGETSFGKGTVQTMIDLDQYARSDNKKFGELKLTIAQFFRINGGTTQLRGVTPDISFPSIDGFENYSESNFDNALPGATIKPAHYVSSVELKRLVPTLLKRHETRIKADKEFICLKDTVENFNRESKKNLMSLIEAERIKERDDREKRHKACDPAAGNTANASTVRRPKDPQVMEGGDPIQDDGLQANERNVASDLALEKAGKKAKDVFLNEAAHIMVDVVALRKSGLPSPALTRQDSHH